MYLHCNIAQNMPEFLPMVTSSEFNDKKLPCAVHIILAAIPNNADAKYSSHAIGFKNVAIYKLKKNTT